MGSQTLITRVSVAIYLGELVMTSLSRQAYSSSLIFNLLYKRNFHFMTVRFSTNLEHTKPLEDSLRFHLH